MLKQQQTSIGSCPAHWEVVKLHTVAELKHGYQFRTEDFTQNGIKIFKITQIKENGSIDLSSCSFIDSTRFSSFEKNVIGQGDILMALSGATIGKIARFKSEETVLQNYRVGNFMPHDEKILNKSFFYYFLTTENTYYQILANQNQSAQENVGKEDIHNMLVFLPPLPEQTAIAEVLSSLDDKIDLLHRQNKTLEQLAETLFRQWFVEEAEECWEEKSLDEIAEFLNGLACQKFPRKSIENGLPVIKIKEMRTGITESSDWATEDVPEKYIIENGDMLFSWSGSLDIVLWFGGKGVLNQHLFKVSSEIFPQWFYYFWAHYHLQEFKGIADDKATTMGHIQRHHLTDARVIVPTKEELQKMDEIVNPIFQKIKSNTRQIRTLTQLSDTLLPKLMSGEVRVKMN